MSSPLDSATYPPPPPPPFPILTSDISGDLSPPPTSSSFSPSLLIIAAILAAVCLTSAAIHFLLRFPYRPSSSSASSTSTSSLPPLIRSTSQTYECAGSGSGPSTSSDCAVCLSRFRPGDELRLLPACRHAFHSPCIDTWLRSPAASCPLCRSPVHFPPPSPPRPPIAEVEGSQREWLKNYVGRLVSSDSSRRFSARWIRRIDGTGNLDASVVGTSGGHHASRWTTDPVAVP